MRKQILHPQRILEIAINQYRLASEFERIERYDQAIRNFRAAIKLSINRPVLRKVMGGAYFHLACIAKKEGKTRQAVNHLKRCQAVYPEHQKSKKMLQDNT